MRVGRVLCRGSSCGGCIFPGSLWSLLWLLRSDTDRDPLQVLFDQDHTKSMSDSKEIVTAKTLWQIHVGLVFMSREEEFYDSRCGRDIKVTETLSSI